MSRKVDECKPLPIAVAIAAIAIGVGAIDLAAITAVCGIFVEAAADDISTTVLIPIILAPASTSTASSFDG
jgi:hypothetical protein